MEKSPLDLINKSAATLKSTSRTAKHSAQNVKNQVKKILKKITPASEKKIFHYEHKQLVWLTISYMILATLVFEISRLSDPNCIPTAVICIITMFFSLMALALTLFVLIYPQNLAVITAKGIKIDHNPQLKWEDVAYAEEKLSSVLTRRPIISLNVLPERLPAYKLTFMQKLCKYNTFTPFSIPLYAMSAAKQDEIRKLIKQYVKEYKIND